jgi:ubiquitin C-terminal hydrolase
MMKKDANEDLLKLQKTLNEQIEINAKMRQLMQEDKNVIQQLTLEIASAAEITIALLNSIAGVRNGFAGDDEVQAFVDQLTAQATKYAYIWLQERREDEDERT